MVLALAGLGASQEPEQKAAQADTSHKMMADTSKKKPYAAQAVSQ